MLAQHKITVTERRSETDWLPTEFAAFVATATRLKKASIFDDVAGKLKLKRRSGNTSIEFFAFLLAFFFQNGSGGLRGFCGRCKPHRTKLAAVCGRQEWPTQASVSRGLSSMTTSQVDEFGQWLLLDATDFSELATDPSAVCRDTHGEAWHMLDFDPTVTAYRQRALPEGDDLPAPERRLAAMAAPGYCGRKRGQVQVNRAMLQHGGTGQWVGAWMSAGNGEGARDLERAVSATERWCGRYGIPTRQAVIRYDGGVGGVRTMRVCRDKEIRYLTRLARYELLKRPDVREHLRTAVWEQVQDSGSGPKRQATEFGEVTLTERDSNKPFVTRVVISRFEAGPTKRGAGKLIDGWHYELFATDLPVERWPASETVTAYYGRCGQENRFYQEDREFGLDRTFSYHRPGQHFAVLVGLYLWNLKTSLGGAAVGAMCDKPPKQAMREVPVYSGDEQSCLTVVDAVDADVDTVANNTQISTQCDRSPGDSTSDGLAKTASNASFEIHSDALPEPIDEHQAAAEPTSVQDEPRADHADADAPAADGPGWRKVMLTTAMRMVLGEKLGAHDWDDAWAKRPGWSWSPTHPLPECPTGTPAPIHSVHTGSAGTRVVFRAKGTACSSCAQREQCSSSTSSHFRKEIRHTLGPGELKELDVYLAKEGYGHIHVACHSLAPTKQYADNDIWKPPAATNAGPHEASWPMLVPSALRKAYDEILYLTEVRIQVEPGTQPPRIPPWLALTPAKRQHRRMTWTQRYLHNALAGDTVVHTDFRGDEKLAQILQPDVVPENARS